MPAGVRRLSLFALLAAGLHPAACLSAPRESGTAAPEPARVATARDSSVAWLRVVTQPPGLVVLVDGDPVGRSPLDSIRLRPGAVHVRVLRDDLRRFDRERDEAVVTLRGGEVASASFDLRPPVALESVPQGAGVATIEDGLPGSVSPLGETPLSLPPAFFSGRSFRFSRAGYADSTLAGRLLLTSAASHGTAVVALRPVSLLPSEPGERTTSFFRRRWVQWCLVGIGAGLTGASAVLKHQGDVWYDRYLDSSDRRVLDTYFDRAVHYDHVSLLSLGVGQAIFTGGLVLLVSGGTP